MSQTREDYRDMTMKCNVVSGIGCQKAKKKKKKDIREKLMILKSNMEFKDYVPMLVH